MTSAPTARMAPCAKHGGRSRYAKRLLILVPPAALTRVAGAADGRARAHHRAVPGALGGEPAQGFSAGQAGEPEGSVLVTAVAVARIACSSSSSLIAAAPGGGWCTTRMRPPFCAALSRAALSRRNRRRRPWQREPGERAGCNTDAQSRRRALSRARRGRAARAPSLCTRSDIPCQAATPPLWTLGGFEIDMQEAANVELRRLAVGSAGAPTQQAREAST